jgi:hypothetical protein
MVEPEPHGTLLFGDDDAVGCGEGGAGAGVGGHTYELRRFMRIRMREEQTRSLVWWLLRSCVGQLRTRTCQDAGVVFAEAGV